MLQFLVSTWCCILKKQNLDREISTWLIQRGSLHFTRNWCCLTIWNWGKASKQETKNLIKAIKLTCTNVVPKNPEKIKKVNSNVRHIMSRRSLPGTLFPTYIHFETEGRPNKLNNILMNISQAHTYNCIKASQDMYMVTNDIGHRHFLSCVPFGFWFLFLYLVLSMLLGFNLDLNFRSFLHILWRSPAFLLSAFFIHFFNEKRKYPD